MKEKLPLSERLLLEEVAEQGARLRTSSRGLEIGELLRMVRLQLGMSQAALARLAAIPQSTISRIERGVQRGTLPTLTKLFEALSCDLVVAPVLREAVDAIRRKQAHRLAVARTEYLKGTMSLEGQTPDARLLEELVKREEEELLRSPNLWGEV